MTFRAKCDRAAHGVLEALVLLMVCASPWAFGAVEPVFEFVLYVGVGLLTVLWGVRILLAGEFAWKKCPVLLCLGALFLLGMWQLLALPRPVLQFLSPHTVELYDALLPATPEVLPLGETWQRPPLAAGASLSVYPGATRRELVRLLAVFLLFAIVRNNLASPDILRRLNFALVGNGALLAFFAIVQFFSSPRDTVYWTFQTQGSVFGPFVCRTHFAFYVNVCIGAGIGLWLSLPRERVGVLHDPARLWLGGALALMVGSVLLSLGRGGFLALLGGGAVVLLAGYRHALRLSRLAPVLVVGLLALALVGWLGFERVEKRLATIWKGEALEQSRWPLWADSWPLVTEFPLLGTGYGTYGYVEPLHRQRTAYYFFNDHAHNEYLEALVEGGIVRLALTLAAISLVGWYGWRAVGQHRGTPAGGLALGALFGVATLVLHSIGDFGIHLPAIAVLATVLCAQLMALGESQASGGRESPGDAPGDFYVFRWRGLAPLAGFVTALALALVLGVEGYRLALVQVLGVEATALAGRTDAASSARREELWQATGRILPDSARVQLELGRAHLEHFERDRGELARGRQLAAAGDLLLAATPGSELFTLPLLAPGSAWDAAIAERRERSTREHLGPALRAYLQARDLCPLLSQPHFRLAANRVYLEAGDSTLAYVDRAKRLVANDPELWYLIGVQEALLGRQTRACTSWRRSLELSDRYLPDILRLGSSLVRSDLMVSRGLPDRPDMLVSSAFLLYPGDDDREARRPFLERALVLLASCPGDGAHFLLRAKCQQHLDQPAAAQESFRQALALEPRNTAWRVKYAGFLHDGGKIAEARQEVFQVLAIEPGNGPALALLGQMNSPRPKGAPELIPPPDAAVQP